ncbi:hypothetical protein ParKJ_00185 [Paraburkholderia fungorum]|jgi:predicted MFS family arabinose efflux permease|uniref:MFS transporter n=1 Tax=Paraburkholderia fungorum TaxID=134537 RepID=A0AAP5URF1_9BURK|nr:hypothetical protein [Paraburkholderia fungorum]MDT8835828.1 hypothetical protein [Paraburkholderia fungorum]
MTLPLAFLLRMLAVATFVVFLQAYMVAPIIPELSNAFGTSVQAIGLVVPAYLIPLSFVD